MRLATMMLMLSMGCSSNGECPKAAFQVLDAARKCLSKNTIGAGCAESAGPPTVRCSVADGTFYISHEGRIFPGGRECTKDEQSALAGVPTCP